MKFKERYLKDTVYGSIDGIITTFAIVSGVLGASLSFGVILILGLANLLADGFSMAISNYLSVKSELERIGKKRKEYHFKVRENPNFEKEELRKIFLKKGFSEAVVNNMISEIILNKEAWEKLMISEIYGEYKSVNPKKSAIATFLAFIFAGSIPLFSFVLVLFFNSFESYAVVSTAILTAVTLFFVGYLKAKITNKNSIRSGLEVLFIGGFAAFVAFFVGFLLKSLA